MSERTELDSIRWHCAWVRLGLCMLDTCSTQDTPGDCFSTFALLLREPFSLLLSYLWRSQHTKGRSLSKLRRVNTLRMRLKRRSTCAFRNGSLGDNNSV